MQKIILDQQLEVICDKDGRENMEIVELDKQEFIQVLLPTQHFNRPISGDLKFWVLTAGNAHRLP